MKTLAILGVALWELIWAAISVIFALAFGLSFVAVVVSYTALVRALTFYYVWAWLIAPIGLPVIPVSVIGGVCLIIAAIKINIEPDKGGPKDGRVLYETTEIDMPRFFATFGLNSPFHRSYVVVHASTEVVAREVMFDTFDKRWAFMYTEDQFRHQPAEHKLSPLCSMTRGSSGIWRAYPLPVSAIRNVNATARDDFNNYNWSPQDFDDAEEAAEAKAAAESDLQLVDSWLAQLGDI